MEHLIREKVQRNEAMLLSSYATLSQNTKGRERPEEECPIRTPFQRDRDRIIHSKAFRRMKHKTQVFLSPSGDHYRTRLTHTLEVSQIARTIARALSLNEDLTEAIAMGHDLGHTPFGHAGERALNEIHPGGFKHYEQSIRVAQKLEKDGRGLNLTWEVLDGMLCHTTANFPQTREGQLVRLSDKIAYINHDIDDAIRAGVLKRSDIPSHYVEIFGDTLSKRINTMVVSVIENSGDEIRMDSDTQKEFFGLREFMFQSVYLNPECKSEEGKAQELLKRLYEHFVTNSHLLPDEYARIREAEGVERAVCDYISGMTDQFAMKCFNEQFVPKTWTVQ